MKQFLRIPYCPVPVPQQVTPGLQLEDVNLWGVKKNPTFPLSAPDFLDDISARPVRGARRPRGNKPLKPTTSPTAAFCDATTKNWMSITSTLCSNIFSREFDFCAQIHLIQCFVWLQNSRLAGRTMGKMTTKAKPKWRSILAFAISQENSTSLEPIRSVQRVLTTYTQCVQVRSSRGANTI